MNAFPHGIEGDLRYNIEIYATLPGKIGRRAAATGGPMGQEAFSSVRYTVYQHLGVLLERLGCINIICLVFL